MNEFITSGLINLFALFSIYTENPENSRKKVNSFLLNNIGKKSAKEFLIMYDDLVDFYITFKIEKEKWLETAGNVIENLKSKITQKEIILLYLRLLELLSNSQNNNIISLIDSTSILFNIEPDLKEELTEFINYGNSNKYNINFKNPYFILIANDNPNAFQNFIQRNLKENLIVYHNPNFNITIIRLVGDEELFIESRPLKSYSFQTLENGDSISGNNIVPVNYSEIIRKLTHSVIEKQIVFESDVIEYKFPNGAFGLHSFSFREESGSMIAIMGGSGTGKTTLLNILNGTLKPSKGNLCINGFNLHSDHKAVEGLIGYVPQEDMLLEDLTVFQNLYYSAKLSFSGLSDNEINERVNKILWQLELDAIKDLKVGSYLNKSISGGQRKRLNIALELIREPAILLVDEPTSGLSSSDSEKVVQLLREQANIGKLIIINIHQPSSQIFRMFDSLWILDKGGYIIFKGAPLDAITHFKANAFMNHPEERECSECGALNPEIIFRIIEDKIIDSTGEFSSTRKNSAEDWHNIFLESNTLERSVSFEKKKDTFKLSKKPSKIKQFLIFFVRNVKVKLSNKPYILVTLLQTPILALLVSYFTYYTNGSGYTFNNNIHLPIFIFMSVIVSLFSGMMASAEEIIKDRTVLKRERFLNLSWGSYLNSKILFLFIISALQSMVFVLIANSILQIEHQFFLYWSVLFATSCIANLIGLNLSNALNTATAIYILIPVILIPQILLGGLIIEFDDLAIDIKTNNNVPFIGDLATSRWAYEAIAVGQYRYNDYQKDLFNFEKDYYNYSYYCNILIYELERRVNDQINKNAPLSEPDKVIIKNELNRIYKRYPALKQGEISYELQSISNSLSFLREQFKFWKYNAEKKLDSVINYKKFQMGNSQYEKLKEDFSNDALADLARKSNSTEFYRETPTNLVRFYAPIFKEPDSNNGKAHFYAANKTLFGYKIETPYFNNIVIWIQGFLLYILLFFNLLRIGYKNK
ncbi:MAG TPA: ATP-binding cassette domain-containing protein [Candidatus Kapabacteria bacterium]|nr:ATP-binding cassette domain-containing protein [Candidatus Kapabacteria bacterium]